MADRRSSSWHTLNADTGLRSWRKLAYLGANALGNSIPGVRDSRVIIQPFQAVASHDEWLSLDAQASIARKWCNLFWMRLPWDALADQVGPLHILDIGCGSGGYGTRFLEWGGESVASYTGVEPSPGHQDRWDQLMQSDSRLKYARGSADDIEQFIEEPINMFVSQSSLEHIDNDVLMLRRVAQSLALRPRPFVQVHLIPAGATLPLYLFHGIRQYTPRTISCLTELFPDAAIKLYGLGGWSSWKLHWRFVTQPYLLPRLTHLGAAHDLRDDPGYPEETWKAYSTDTARGKGPALFYALVLLHEIDSAII